MKLIQRRRLGLPIPDPFDVAWEFSKGEMSLEKSVFDWFDSSLDQYRPKMTPPKPPRHADALKNIRTKERVAEEEWMEEERAAIRRILEGDFSDFETETKDNVVADMPFVAEIPDANLRDIEPEVVMPDKPKTVTEGIKAARARTKRTVEDVLNSGMVTGPETTPKSVIEELHGMVEDGDEDAAKIFYNNQDELVRHGYDEEHEFFQKGIQTIVENPFANPFYDMSAFSIKKERPKGFVAPPAFTPPIDLIKQEQPNAIEGFETNEGDDLSLLPSSVFKNTDAPVVDNMSLLPTGWKNE